MVHVSTAVGAQETSFSANLSTRYPRTARLYLQYVQEAMPVREVAEILRQPMAESYLQLYSPNLDFHLSIDKFPLEEKDIATVEKELRALADWLEQAASTPIEPHTPSLTLDVYCLLNGRHEGYAVCVATDRVPGSLLRLWRMMREAQGLPTDQNM